MIMIRPKAEQVKKQCRELEHYIKLLEQTPPQQQRHAQELIARCRAQLEKTPKLDQPIFVHVIGTNKSYKTSYILDLFQHDGLRNTIRVAEATADEHTAVPCLVQPDEKAKQLTIQRLSLETGEVMGDVDPTDFKYHYDLTEGVEPSSYMLRVLLPIDETPMKLPVIEYPGMKSGADMSPEEEERHKIFVQNMKQALRLFPGFFVACFQPRLDLPKDHPVDTILKHYAQSLNTDYQEHKLPLIISLQGVDAVRNYCGSTNVMENIRNDFKSYELFATKLQLVNPSYKGQRPIDFPAKGSYVDEWIQKVSDYNNIEEIYAAIKADGGIGWSRQYLQHICEGSHIYEAVDNIFLRSWITETEQLQMEIATAYDAIKSYDLVRETRKKIHQLIQKGEYTSLREYFEKRLSDQPVKTYADLEKLWLGVLMTYIEQFFDAQTCAPLASALWEMLLFRLDPDNYAVGQNGFGENDPGKRRFVATRSEDVPYIMLNFAEMYVPNAILRGDPQLYGRIPA